MIRRFARPYAKAMMEVAGTPQQAKAAWEELSRFDESRKASPQLCDLLASPAVDMSSKQKIVAAVAAKMGTSDLGKRLLQVLVQNHRANDIGAILEAWRAMINEALGIAVADVRSAQPLSEQDQERLKKSLRSKLGRDVELHVTTDPSLLGGFVARVGSEVYDASVVGRIAKLRHALS